jgi:hypothetical protein
MTHKASEKKINLNVNRNRSRPRPRNHPVHSVKQKQRTQIERLIHFRPIFRLHPQISHSSRTGTLETEADAAAAIRQRRRPGRLEAEGGGGARSDGATRVRLGAVLGASGDADLEAAPCALRRWTSDGGGCSCSGVCDGGRDGRSEGGGGCGGGYTCLRWLIRARFDESLSPGGSDTPYCN